MKNISAVSDSKDIVTVEYLDDVTAAADKSSNFTINGTVHYPLLAVTAYGRSWQLGEHIVNVADVGINGYGLPVSSDGNYTDANGQQWVCDELIVNADGTGKIVRRTHKESINISDFSKTANVNTTLYGYDHMMYLTSRTVKKLLSVSNTYRYNTIDNPHYYTDQRNLRIYVSNGKVGAFESNESVIIVYDITNPYETELTAEQITVLQPLIDKYGAFTAYFMSTQDGTPTPENPVDIVSTADLHSVSVPIESIGDSGSLTVTACGKNLLSYAESGVKTRNGLTVESFGNGEYHVYGTVTAAATVIKFPLVCPSFIPDAKIYLSLNNTSAYSNIASISFADTDGNEIGSLGINTVNRIHTTSTYNGKTIAAVSFYVANGNSVDYYIKPQFEIDNATEYEQYKSTAATVTTGLPLRGLPVSSGGNYTDSNGQEWICDTIEYNYTSAVKKQRTAVIDSYNGENVGNNYISTTGGLDVGATVIYPAENVIETPLTADEINQLRNLETFDGVTNIFNSENAEMSVEYLTSKSVSKAVMPIIAALRGDNNA